MNTDHLHEPQKAHTKVLLDSIFFNGFAFDASPTGTGKTYCASSVAKNLNVPVVVICPRVSRKTWITTLALFGVKPHVVINYEKLIRGNTIYYKFDKKEYLNAKHWWESQGIILGFPKDSLIILDECHKCKGPKSKNGQMLTALKNAGYKLLMLSATAATNATEMRHFGYATHLHTGRDFYSFARDHGAIDDGFGGLKWDKDSHDATIGMAKIHEKLFNIQTCASKMNREDFGDIFPENQIIAQSFDLGDSNSSKLQSIYDTMEDELAQLEARAENYSEHVFAIMMKARRLSELCKVPVTTEWIEERIEDGKSPIVFFNFSDSLQAVENRLSPSLKNLVAKIVGGQKEHQRDLEIEEFQADKRRIALVNMAAGSVSVSLHDLNGNYPRQSLICPSWSAILTLQAIGRIFRANGKTKCIQEFLFASEIEERQRARVAAKIRNIESLNDGDLNLTDSIALY